MASVTAGQRARPATDRGERIYAIGDVHGCYELLVALLARLDEHDAGLPAARSQHMLLLGDLIDRAATTMLHVSLDRVSPLAVPVLILIGREQVAQSAAEDALLMEAEALVNTAMRAD